MNKANNFEKKFPSIHKKYEHIPGNWVYEDIIPIREIEECCLDKSKVKYVLELFQRNQTNEVEEVIEQIFKELGLD